jgi:hypothetical protein
VQDIAITVPDSPELSKELSALAWRWWKKNRMDEGQQHAHFSACRDGDSFGVTWYDSEQAIPRVSVHQVYDGQTSGADMFYTDGDPMQPLYGVKIWIVSETDAAKIRRKNIYYTDRVEKWISDGAMVGEDFTDADWRALQEGDDGYDETLVVTDSISRPGEMVTVVWWTDDGLAPRMNLDGTPSNKSLGLPIHHFRHDARGTAYGTSAIEMIVPGVQDAVNRASLSVQTATLLNGFKVAWATKFDPDISEFEVYPAAIIYNPEDGSFGQLNETDLRQLIEVKDTFIKDSATLTSTPLTYFNLSGVVPAEGTQQSLEMALLAKVNRDQVSFGNTWEDITRAWLRLEKAFGTKLADVPEELIDELEINVEWKSAKVKNEREEVEIATALKALGVPDRFIFRRLGFSEDEIEEIKTEKETKRAVVLGAMTNSILEQEAANAANNGADTTNTEPAQSAA